MKSSEILREAAKLIKTNKVYYLCTAIWEVAPCRRITREIDRRLHPYGTLDSWLYSGARIPLKQLTGSAVRAHRVRWALKMADEFEAKGD
jgi:hypothetical protein